MYERELIHRAGGMKLGSLQSMHHFCSLTKSMGRLAWEIESCQHLEKFANGDQIIVRCLATGFKHEQIAKHSHHHHMMGGGVRSGKMFYND